MLPLAMHTQDFAAPIALAQPMVPDDLLPIVGNVELDDAIHKKHTSHRSVERGKRWRKDELGSGCTRKRPDTHHWRLTEKLFPVHASILLDVKAVGRWAKSACALLLRLAPKVGHFV